MTTTSFLLPIEFDLAATFLMAMTGVWAASRRGYDVIGAFTLAFVSGVGGGLLRDSVFLSQPPAVMENPLYLFAVLAAVVIGVLFYRAALRFERVWPTSTRSRWQYMRSLVPRRLWWQLSPSERSSLE